MQKIILKLFQENPSEKFTRHEIAKLLNLSMAQNKKLDNDLESLVKEAKLLLDTDNCYAFRDEKRILKGKLKLHNQGFGFFIPDDTNKKDTFIPSRQLNYAMDNDEVLVESYRNKKDGRFEGRVIEIVNRGTSRIVGQVNKSGKHFFIQPIEKGFPFEIYIPIKKLNNAKHDDMVAVTIIQYPGQDITAMGEVSQIFGQESNSKVLTQAILFKHDIKSEFSAAIQKELKSVPEEIEDTLPADRIDLRHLPIITIDGITAKDFDDAVCVVKKGKSYILYVSIADVSEYVKIGTELDTEAQRRGTSTYLPGECIPMLPEKLSNNLCSLVPHEPRYTLTAEIHYNLNFEFTKASFYRSFIKSKKRATYEEVQGYFDGLGHDSFDKPIRDSLDIMKTLSERLIKQAFDRGSLDFDLPESELVYDSNGRITTIQKSQRFFSHRLIEVFMIAANEAVAQLFRINNLPLMNRIHENPDPFKMGVFTDTLNNLGFKIQNLKQFNQVFNRIEGHALESFLKIFFLRSLKQAQYSIKNTGHYGLGLKDYAHYTSPIRRYPDLTVHRQLISLIQASGKNQITYKKADIKSKPKKFNKKLCYKEQEIEQLAKHCSERERETIDAEREVIKIKKAQFVERFLGKSFHGLITRIGKQGMGIELEPYFVEGFLSLTNLKNDYFYFDDKNFILVGKRTKQRFKIGDHITVIVDKVDVLEGDIVLAIKGTDNHQNKRHGKRNDKRNEKRQDDSKKNKKYYKGKSRSKSKKQKNKRNK
ncbi:ribonuclease R [bacterium K02(2017)]|nr:ribonuclease R [bacterium K02(2017)]